MGASCACCNKDDAESIVDIVRSRHSRFSDCSDADPLAGERIATPSAPLTPRPKLMSPSPPPVPVPALAASLASDAPELDEVDCISPIGAWLTLQVYDDGSRYEGELRDGKRHGFGQWTSAFESYEGQWADDRFHGDGRQTWTDGRSYEGQFKGGKFHGIGRMEWDTAQGVVCFEGRYVEDLKHGTGKYTWPDGRMYDGEWQAGLRHGRAIHVGADGRRTLGVWRDDRLDRQVTREEFAQMSKR